MQFSVLGRCFRSLREPNRSSLLELGGKGKLKNVLFVFFISFGMNYVIFLKNNLLCAVFVFVLLALMGPFSADGCISTF